MAKKNEVTVEDKLRALYDLQLIDSRVDEIRNVRGELPLEVEDLEGEIAGLEKRLESFNQEVNDFDFQTKEQKNNIEIAKEEFKKYEGSESYQALLKKYNGNIPGAGQGDRSKGKTPKGRNLGWRYGTKGGKYNERISKKGNRYRQYF